MSDDRSLYFHVFVEDKLAEQNLKIIPITEDLMRSRLTEFSDFINSIRLEFAASYNWKAESNEYLLNPMKDKWKFSYCMLDTENKICFVNLSSVYDNIIHNHCTYVREDKRNLNLAKLHMIKLCQTGIDNGFTEQEGYWPKNNNRSIILFLKMGWQIESIRNNRDLKMKADLRLVRDRTYQLLARQY